MLTTFVMGSALVSGSFAALVPASRVVSTSDALITPGPPRMELLRRQNDVQYVGWVSDVSWSADTCGVGSMYYQASGAWDCCPASKVSCDAMPVGCAGNNMVYRFSATGSSALSNSLRTYPCSSIYTGTAQAPFSICNTFLMFENDRDTNPKVGLGCGKSSKVWNYYRTPPAIATPGPSSRIISASTSTSVTRTSSTDIASPIATPLSAGGDGNGNGNGEQKSKSKAWIAGAVIGPLLGLALIGLLAFFFIRRKKNKSHNQTVAPASGSVPAPGATAYQQNTYPTNVGSPQPPQYHPEMQQNAAAAPFGTGKQDGYYASGPQSPMTSQGSQSPYGAPQQWQQHGAQPVYNAPSPSMSPAPHHAQPTAAPYNAAQRHFSSELEGSNMHGQPEVVNVQPKK